MITIDRFIDAFGSYQQRRYPYRLLQDQAAVLIAICRNTYRPIADALDVTDADINWLLQQPEAADAYADLVGGNVYICETTDDLKQIVGMDMDWASSHGNQWPNVTDQPMAWDTCTHSNTCYSNTCSSKPRRGTFCGPSTDRRCVELFTTHTYYPKEYTMKYRGKSPSEKFVAAVVGFIAGTHLHHKPRISTLSLMLELRKSRRLARELQKSLGKEG